MTNYEKIKSMNIDEMKDFLIESIECCCNCCSFEDIDNDCDWKGCKQGIKQWLEKETEE